MSAWAPPLLPIRARCWALVSQISKAPSIRSGCQSAGRGRAGGTLGQPGSGERAGAAEPARAPDDVACGVHLDHLLVARVGDQHVAVRLQTGAQRAVQVAPAGAGHAGDTVLPERRVPPPATLITRSARESAIRVEPSLSRSTSVGPSAARRRCRRCRRSATPRRWDPPSSPRAPWARRPRRRRSARSARRRSVPLATYSAQTGSDSASAPLPV